KHNLDLIGFAKAWLLSLFNWGRIVHITGGANYMVLAFPFQRRVITIHDFFHLKGDSKSIVYRLLYYKLPMEFAHKIVVVSDRTLADLKRMFPKMVNKTAVIRNPLTIVPSKEPLIRENPPRKPEKILQIGCKPHKNFHRLFKACEGLDVELLLVHGYTTGLDELLDSHGLKDRTWVYSNLSKQELIDLYKEADLLYFASLDEGFGLPLLEAQAMRLPIITSDIEPMVSIAPEAILVNPWADSEIKNAVEQFIEKGFAPEHLEKAAQRLHAFAPSKIAKLYEQLYEQL
uniref:glycosyltransferase n=2 Tax=Gilvibacter sp. TaxID=2729997 RepID=UPI0035BE3D5D